MGQGDLVHMASGRQQIEGGCEGHVVVGNQQQGAGRKGEREQSSTVCGIGVGVSKAVQCECNKSFEKAHQHSGRHCWGRY